MNIENINRLSIAKNHPKEARVLLFMVVLAFGMLMIGLLSPIITLEKFYIVENTFSIFSGVVQLVYEGQWVLFVLIGGFSIVLPILKLGVLFRLLIHWHDHTKSLQRYLRLMHDYGKWSMLDVFVVAILVVSVKLGAIASVETHFGLYAFAGAVLLTMVVTARVVKLSNHLLAD